MLKKVAQAEKITLLPNSYKLVIKAAEKIQKQGYYPANLKDEIIVFSTTLTEKEAVDYILTCPRSK